MALQLTRAFLFITVVVKFVSSTSSLSDADLPEIFYPFGSDVGDRVVPVSDSLSAASVSIDFSFPFFNSSYRTVVVNNNGVLSFNDPIISPIPQQFPISHAPLIAPFWTDVDTKANSGRVYYRQTTDKELLDRASADIESVFYPHFHYQPSIQWIFVATWNNVTYFGGNAGSPVQTFQAVLATDGVHSFALFNYGTLAWTHGPVNSVPALVGFSAGDGANYYEIPASRTPEVLIVYLTTNGESPGRWVFRFDREHPSQTGRVSQKARVVDQATAQPSTSISDGNVYPFGLLDIDVDRSSGGYLQIMVCNADFGAPIQHISLQHERLTVDADISSNFTFIRQTYNITGIIPNADTYDVYPEVFFVLADGNVRTFVVQAQFATTDGYLVLPVTPDSTEFFVAGWLSQRSGIFYSGVQVTSVYPNTVVDFYRVRGDSYTLLSSSYIATSRTSGLFVVNFGEDTTGLYVNSSQPIGVTAVAMCANVPSISVDACDLMVEQMPPVSELGTVHVVPPIAGRSILAGYLVRVVATELDTVVTWASSASVQPASPVTLTRGQFVEINVQNTAEPLMITCSKRCLVTQYNKGGVATPEDSGLTDPSMMLTTPVDHFASETCFMTAYTSNSNYQLIEYNNFVSIVALAEDIDSILLDGQPLNSTNVVRLRQTIGDYSVDTSPIAHGSHRIDVARGSNAQFAAYVYGHATDTAYGYPAVYEVDGGCGGADSTWKTAERHKRQQYYGRRRPASQQQSSDQNPAEVDYDYDVDAMNQFYQDGQQSAANGRREQPPRPADSYNYVVDAAPTYSIKCYACHYQFEDNHGQGVFGCRDPFVPDYIPIVDCAGPCAKIFRKLHAKDDYSLTRSCMPNCKDSFYTECCLASLCNSAGWTKVSTRHRFAMQHLLIIVLATLVLVVSCLLSTC